jgi:hypothetical protein
MNKETLDQCNNCSIWNTCKGNGTVDGNGYCGNKPIEDFREDAIQELSDRYRDLIIQYQWELRTIEKDWEEDYEQNTVRRKLMVAMFQKFIEDLDCIGLT